MFSILEYIPDRAQKTYTDIRPFMRRALASILLAVFSFLLIAPVAFADPESNLPACCRRDGAHHCSMGATMNDEASGSGFQAARDRCPAFPIASASPTGAEFALANRAGVVSRAELSYPSVPFQTESRFSVSFSRSRQKRGPPAVVCQ